MSFHTEDDFKILSGEDVSMEKLEQLGEFQTSEDLVEYYYHVYPNKHYFNYPEFSVKKLGLDKNSLNTLPTKNERQRADIYRWMKSQKLSVEDWMYIGW